MDPIGRWNIWGKSGERIRQFTVALASEHEAIAMLKAENPDIAVVSWHAVGLSVLDKIGMADCDITEWVPLDGKQRLPAIGGIASRRAMKT